MKLCSRWTRALFGGSTAVFLAACSGAPPTATAPLAAPAPTASVQVIVAPTAAAAGETTQAAAPAAEAPAASDATTVVERFVAAVNAGDLAGTRAMFAPNGEVVYAGSAPKTGTEIDSWLQSDVFGVQGRIENPTLTAQGNQVTLSGQYQSSGWSGRANYVFTVENGRVRTWELR